MARISTEVKRMHQHRRRHHANGSSSPPSMSETMISPTQLHKKELSNSLLASAASGVGCASALHCRDAPVLSLKQVGLVCERMMKEREDQLREEYDKVLNEKLNGLSTSSNLSFSCIVLLYKPNIMENLALCILCSGDSILFYVISKYGCIF